jgi:general secretion pathway protein N
VIRGVLLALVLALGGLLFIQWWHWPPALDVPRSEPAPAVPQDDENATDTLTELAPPESREAYASVAERPLFRPARKPPEPLPAEPPPEQPSADAESLDGIDLSAVVIAPGIALAWIKDPSASELKRLRLGDEHAGWSVKDIRPDRLVLERQGEMNELILRDFSQASTASSVPVPSAAPRSVPRPANPNGMARPNPAARSNPNSVRPNPNTAARPNPNTTARPNPNTAARPNPGVARPSRPSQRVPQNAPPAGVGEPAVPSNPPQPRPNVRRPSPPAQQ